MQDVEDFFALVAYLRLRENLRERSRGQNIGNAAIHQLKIVTQTL